MKIAIIGKGSVGSALCNGLSGKHEVKFGHRDPAEPVAEAAKWGEVIISSQYRTTTLMTL
jgi:predicted dinucleotide-binding enzyme